MDRVRVSGYLLLVLWALVSCVPRPIMFDRKVYMPVIQNDGDLRGVEVWPGSHHLDDLQLLRPALVRVFVL